MDTCFQNRKIALEHLLISMHESKIGQIALLQFFASRIFSWSVLNNLYVIVELQTLPILPFYVRAQQVLMPHRNLKQVL